MEFDSPGFFTTSVSSPTTLELSLDDLDSILEVDVVATVPPLTNVP